MAAYEMGYEKASQSIVDPTNASRKVLKKFLDEHNFTYILGKGYYAFIQVGNWIRREAGLTASRWASTWLRIMDWPSSPALSFLPTAVIGSVSLMPPPERTLGAAERLIEGLNT